MNWKHYTEINCPGLYLTSIDGVLYDTVEEICSCTSASGAIVYRYVKDDKIGSIVGDSGAHLMLFGPIPPVPSKKEAK